MKQNKHTTRLLGRTTNYNQFKKIKGNRQIYNTSLKRLTQAIKQKPQLLEANPIIINERFEIIDGQHRLEACKALNYPVYYAQIEGLTLTDVQKLNSHRKAWLPIDVALSFAELGNQDYATYVVYKLKYGLNHEVTMKYLGLTHYCTTLAFKDGKFRAPNPERSTELIEQLIQIGEFYERYGLRPFAYGFLAIAQNPVYEHNRMLEQLKKHKTKLLDHVHANDYSRNLEEIYNFGLGHAKQTPLFTPRV